MTDKPFLTLRIAISLPEDIFQRGTMLTAAQHAIVKLYAKHGHSKREISRLTGHSRDTIKRVLSAPDPLASGLRFACQELEEFRNWLERRASSRPISCTELAGALRRFGFAVPCPGSVGRKTLCQNHAELIMRKFKDGLNARKIHQELVLETGFRGSYPTVTLFLRKLNQRRNRDGILPKVRNSPSSLPNAHAWMLRLLQGDIDARDLVADTGKKLSLEDADLVVKKVRTSRLAHRNRAVAVAARLRGISLTVISRFLFLSRSAVRKHFAWYHHLGLPRVFEFKRDQVMKADDPYYKDAVFKILHAPPRDHGFNRTSWRMPDLQKALKNQGCKISSAGIRQIIRKAGYGFHKAKIVLTSSDPDYRAKLEQIKNILRNLKPDEKFFSVDEYGPFAVKMQGGRSLMPPGEFRTVPARQKSKGSLILTAALELSENQVTHFYSERKNTDEMLKLLEILLEKYSRQSCIYFSWDAASWHASKKLYTRVEEINSAEYRAAHKGPLVKLAPLPSCAQFLNVIESVFSGMAKAIIHNSDYQSVDECKAAIDRHFEERNQHFKASPKRAGNKIWGKEIVPPVFDETHNCKDPDSWY